MKLEDFKDIPNGPELLRAMVSPHKYRTREDVYNVANVLKMRYYHEEKDAPNGFDPSLTLAMCFMQAHLSLHGRKEEAQLVEKVLLYEMAKDTRPCIFDHPDDVHIRQAKRFAVP